MNNYNVFIGCIIALFPFSLFGQYATSEHDNFITLREVRYHIGAITNEGKVADGLDVTAVFQELPEQRTLVSLVIIGEKTATNVSHTAHIHFNDVATGGGIAYFLGPIDGLAGAPGASSFVVEEDFDILLSFNGHINIHESNSNLQIMISAGDIGQNASGSVVESPMRLIQEPRSYTYRLTAVTNNGVIPDGIDVLATLSELTATSTLVKLESISGSTNTNVSHTAHIHFNSAEAGGGIAYFLGPIDGLGAASGVSYEVVEESLDFLINFDGHINIHESNSNLSVILSQGNIGANALVTWLGFDTDSHGWVDTGDWLGLLYVRNAPWIYNLNLSRWIHLQQAGVTSSGGWVFLPGSTVSVVPDEPTVLNVLNSGASTYVIDDQSNPTLTFVRGRTYDLNISAPGHPFWIKTSPVTGTGSAYHSGVTNNGASSGVISFTVPSDAPDTLYYICQFHSAMQGTINIID